MDSGWGKLAGFLVVLGLVLGVKFCGKQSLSRDVRKAMYERYSELGDAEAVKTLVDESHDAFFSQCYKMGFLKGSKTEFDAERYADLMDDKVGSELQAARMKTQLAAQNEAREAAARRPAPVTLATPTPAPAHRVEISSMVVRAPAEGEAVVPSDSRGYMVDVLVADEADDIQEDTPPGYETAVVCDPGGFLGAPRQGRVSKVRGMGTGKAVVSVPLTLTTAEAAGKRCEVLVSITDRGGNKAAQARRDLPFQ
jgi:hypothetical protein